MNMESLKQPVVVLIEDEPQIRRFLRITLAEHGFALIEASTGLEGIQRVDAHHPGLILLDLGLPDIDGIEVARRLRAKTHTPIIILSARGEEQQKILALDAGADDYVTKPFSIGELLARMRAALRRAGLKGEPGKEQMFVHGSLSIDFERRLVTVADKEVHLTPNEWDLLILLIENAGKVVTHKQLLRSVWGEQYAQETHYLRVYMAQLRHKLEEDPARPKFLLTEPGIGYRFKV
jgi:two-component system KDP operon response regulator KdpE